MIEDPSLSASSVNGGNITINEKTILTDTTTTLTFTITNFYSGRDEVKIHHYGNQIKFISSSTYANDLNGSRTLEYIYEFYPIPPTTTKITITYLDKRTNNPTKTIEYIVSSTALSGSIQSIPLQPPQNVPLQPPQPPQPPQQPSSGGIIDIIKKGLIIKFFKGFWFLNYEKTNNKINIFNLGWDSF
jgi:hypothetical protein